MLSPLTDSRLLPPQPAAHQLHAYLAHSLFQMGDTMLGKVSGGNADVCGTSNIDGGRSAADTRAPKIPSKLVPLISTGSVLHII